MTTAQQGVAASKPRRSWWSAITQWRNWRIPAKLIAVLLVPVVASLVLGELRISGEVSKANSYVRIDGLVAVQSKLQDVINDVQDERTLSAEFLGGTGVNDPAILVRQADRTDTAAADLHNTVTATLDPAMAAKYNDAAGQFGALAPLRQHIRGNTTDAATAQAAYTTVVDALLGFDQTLVSQFGDPVLGSTASGVYAVIYAEEQDDLQHAIVSAGLGRGRFLPAELQALRDTVVRTEDKLADVRVVASPQQLKLYDQVETSPDVVARRALLATVMQTTLDPTPPKHGKMPPPPVNADEWNKTSNNVTSQVRAAERSVVNDMRNLSASQQDQASNQAGLESVILLSILLLAMAVLVVIGRGLLTSLGVLRRTALDVADRRLPAAVANIRDGREMDTTIEPVPIDTTEEVGQLARAVDEMHGQAVRLAAEQATLRQNLNTTFINVSRRSQSLVERLLRQLEQLEKNEEDPDQLSNLFKLDHLATRMRRNNENLMVLSGNDLARRAAQPLAIADVLRAAVSEIDQYERAVVRPSPSVHVAGYVSGDLVRLLAELLDNAAQYSSPETQVTIATHQSVDRKVIIEILDEGIGMSEDELLKVNRRLAEAGNADAAVSRQMGLFVVSKLAARHGVQVVLSGGEEGLLASVTLPEDVLAAQSERSGGLIDSGMAQPPVGKANGSSASNGVSGLFGQVGGTLPPLDADEPADAPLAESTGDWDARELEKWSSVGGSTDTGSTDTGEQPAAAPSRSGVPQPRVESMRNNVSTRESYPPFESPFTGLSSESSSATDLFKPVKEPSDAPDYEWDDDLAGTVYSGRTTAGESALRTSDPNSTGWFEAIPGSAASAPSAAEASEEWFGVEPLSASETSQPSEPQEPPAGFASWARGREQADEARGGESLFAEPDVDRSSDLVGQRGGTARNGGDIGSESRRSSEFDRQDSFASQGMTNFSSAEPSNFAPVEPTKWQPSPAPRKTDAPATGDQGGARQVVSSTPGVPPLPKRTPRKSRKQQSAAEQPPAAPQESSTRQPESFAPEPPAAQPTPVQHEPEPRPAEPPVAQRTESAARETSARETPARETLTQLQSELQWTSPADAGWQAARELAEAQPAAHTAAGLPRRVPKAHLLPGSAGPAPSNSSAPPKRNAADVRGRLNSLQSGIRDGRHRRPGMPEEHSENGQEGDRS